MARDKVFYGGLVLLVIVLIGADFVYFSNLDEAEAPSVQPAEAAQAPSPASAPSVAGMPVADCVFDTEKTPVEDFAALVNPEDPVYGNPDAPVTLIEYFDPNCPHCKDLHPVMNATLATYGDQIRVVYKPVALPGWTWSVPQVSALWTAAAEGKFKEMLDRQFEMQKRGGLSIDEIKSIAQEIGVDANRVEREIAASTHDDRMAATMTQIRQIGMTGVPAVMLNGRVIASSSRNTPCFAQLIESVLSQEG